MKVIHEYPLKVFSNEYQGKTFYKVGISKKDQNGNYINGYIDCQFRKDTKVDVSKKIYIKDSWLDFYVKDKVTHIYLFINQFEYVSEVVEESKDAFQEFADELELDSTDLPF